MRKEYKLDEIFVYKGIEYIVKEGDSCACCDFYCNDLCNPRRNGKVQPELINEDIICLPSLRKDKIGVIFRETKDFNDIIKETK